MNIENLSPIAAYKWWRLLRRHIDWLFLKDSSKSSSNSSWVILRWISLPPIPADSRHKVE